MDFEPPHTMMTVVQNLTPRPHRPRPWKMRSEGKRFLKSVHSPATPFGPSPLESLPILYLLSSSCSSNDEFLVHPSVIRVIGRSSRSQKLQVVFFEFFSELDPIFSFSASELIMIEMFLFVLREV